MVAIRSHLTVVMSVLLAATAHAGGGVGKKAKGKPATPDGSVASPGAVSGGASDLDFGETIQFHNISIIPVVTNKPGPFRSYTLLEAGIDGKTLGVRELNGSSSDAQVNAVEVRNKGRHAVYLLGGEMILGGKQDRIVAQDTVVPASGKWNKVAVFCVEQGRWNGGAMKFSSGSAMADIAVRRAAMGGKQGEVWKEVAKKNAKHGTQSSTSTYRRTVQNAKLRKKIGPYVRQLRAKLPRNQRLAGFVFGINGKIRVADLFGNPELFAGLNEKLLSAYVLEALSRQTDNRAAPVAKDKARNFLLKGRAAKATSKKKSGRATVSTKDNADFIGASTADDDAPEEAVRETYIKKE